jgi:hypothetical protein
MDTHDKVAPTEGHRPSLALNRRRLGETSPLDFSIDVARELGLVERGDGLRDVATKDLDGLFATPFLHLSVGSGSDAFVLTGKNIRTFVLSVVVLHARLDATPLTGKNSSQT